VNREPIRRVPTTYRKQKYGPGHIQIAVRLREPELSSLFQGMSKEAQGLTRVAYRAEDMGKVGIRDQFGVILSSRLRIDQCDTVVLERLTPVALRSMCFTKIHEDSKELAPGVKALGDFQHSRIVATRLRVHAKVCLKDCHTQ